MKLYNLKDHNEQVSFAQAVTQDWQNQGLFFLDLPEFQLTDIDELLKQDLSLAAQKFCLRLSATKSRRSCWRERTCGVRLPGTGPSRWSRMWAVWSCSTVQRWRLKTSAAISMAQMLTHISGDKAGHHSDRYLRGYGCRRGAFLRSGRTSAW